jgi:hypothetical protein
MMQDFHVGLGLGYVDAGRDCLIFDVSLDDPCMAV